MNTHRVLLAILVGLFTISSGNVCLAREGFGGTIYFENGTRLSFSAMDRIGSHGQGWGDSLTVLYQNSERDVPLSSLRSLTIKHFDYSVWDSYYMLSDEKTLLEAETLTGVIAPVKISLGAQYGMIVYMHDDLTGKEAFQEFTWMNQKDGTLNIRKITFTQSPRDP